MDKSSPTLLDVTVRDGSYLINHNWKPEQVAAIAKGLAEAGMSWAEISHGGGLGAKLMGFPGLVSDEELLLAARQAAPDLKLSAFISSTDLSAALLPSFVDYFDMGRVGVNVESVPLSEKFIKKLKHFNKQISIQLVRTHTRPPDFVGKQAKLAHDLGADVVYVVDSFGSMVPDEVTHYVEAVQEQSSVAVGFHGHNMTGMAIPNTWAAWQAGATWLDASLLGVGRGAGNTNLEMLVAALQNSGTLATLSLEKLCQTTRQSVAPIFGAPPQTSLFDLKMAEEHIDYPYPAFLELLANYLGISFDSLLTQAHGKMQDMSQLADDHLRLVAKDYGKDFDQLVNLFKVQIPS